MRIWLILSIALVVHQTCAQVTFGPDGLQLPSIKIIAIFNFLRKCWKMLTHTEPSKTTTRKNYNSGITCLKNGTVCEETRVVDMARVPNNALNKKILKRLNAQKSHTNFFSLKTEETEEGRFNPMLFPSPDLRTVLWVRFYYVFFFAILIFVIIFSAPYFFTGMILQELKEGSEAGGTGDAIMNSSYNMTDDDMDMTMNDTMNDTMTMEDGMEECMEDMSNEDENDNDMNNNAMEQMNDVSQNYSKSQTTEISSMNRERERDNQDEMNAMIQLNGTDETHQTNIMNQSAEADNSNNFNRQRFNEQVMEQLTPKEQMNLLGTSHMSQINDRNITKGFSHTTEMEEMQQVSQEKNSPQTIDIVNLMNKMQRNEMEQTKERFRTNITGQRYSENTHNNTAQNQAMQQIHYLDKVNGNGMRPTNGARQSVEIDNNNKNEMQQIKEQHRMEHLHPWQKNNFKGTSHMTQMNSKNVTNGSEQNTAIEEMQQVSQENAMRKKNSPQTIGGMNQMNYMQRNEMGQTKEPFRTNIILLGSSEKMHNKTVQNQTIQHLYRGELIKQWHLIGHENSTKQMNLLKSHYNRETANPFQRQTNGIASIELDLSHRIDHRIPKMQHNYIHKKYNKKGEIITQDNRYSGYGGRSGLPSMTYSDQFEYMRPNEGLSPNYFHHFGVGFSPFIETRINSFHNIQNSQRRRIENELRQSLNIRENKVVGQNFDVQPADNMMLNSGIDIYNKKPIYGMRQMADTNNDTRQVTNMQQINIKRKKKKRKKK